MRYLLDTHAFLWWVADDERLSQPVRERLRSRDHEVFLSVVSSWELAIKAQLGRIAFEEGLAAFVTGQVQRNGFGILPVGLAHTFALHGLPPLHRDPFDRMLVAQALAEGLTLVTVDPQVRRYDVPTLW